jgi:apolipoprotein D and lipocalin family protein
MGIGSSNPSMVGTLPTVPSVDLNRYQGKWHEIARLPIPYEQDCINSTAMYTLLANDKIKVVNQCLANGVPKSVSGIATPAPNARILPKGVYDVPILQPGMLQISFPGNPRKGDYYILDLATNYEYSLVGTPDRTGLWILSRYPYMDPSLYERLVKKARNLGFDVEKLVFNQRLYQYI